MPFALLLIFALFALPAAAALSRAELRELVSKGVSSDVVLSLVTKHCVDFDLDKQTRKAWSKEIDSAVIDAMLACRQTVRDGTASSVGQPTMPQAVVPLRRAAPPPPGTVRYAVVPLTVDGEVDLEITSLFLDQLRDHVSPAEVIDPFTFGMHFGDPDNFNAGAAEETLVAAASRAGATVIVVAKAFAYKQFQDFAMRVDAKLLDAGDGSQVWKESGRGSNGNRSWSSAKKRAVIDLMRKLPKDAARAH
jgi:hypothetical protein